MLLVLLWPVITANCRYYHLYVYVDFVKFVDHILCQTFILNNFEIVEVKTVFNTQFVGIFICIYTPNFIFLDIIHL